MALTRSPPIILTLAALLLFSIHLTLASSATQMPDEQAMAWRSTRRLTEQQFEHGALSLTRESLPLLTRPVRERWSPAADPSLPPTYLNWLLLLYVACNGAARIDDGDADQANDLTPSYTECCSVCREIQEPFRQYAIDRYRMLHVGRVNCTHEVALCRAHNVTRVPTFQLYDQMAI